MSTDHRATAASRAISRRLSSDSDAALAKPALTFASVSEVDMFRLLLAGPPPNRIPVALHERGETGLRNRAAGVRRHQCHRRWNAFADIRDVREQMAFFERLIVDNGVASVVDLSHRTFDNFFTVVGEIG